MASAHEPGGQNSGGGQEPAAQPVAPAASGSEKLEAIDVKTEKRAPVKRKKRAPAPAGRPSGETATSTASAEAPGSPAIGGGADAGNNGPIQSSSERTISGAQVNERPFSRPAEALESVPGLIITQHSGEGKANQYFLRGFNLDHGADLALTLDGMPLNMPTHGHGQGYADANFLIPELIASVQYRKGPYFAEEGDFSSAGAVHIDYLDHPDKNLALATYGSFGYARALGVASEKLGNGVILGAAEASVYDGPWQVSDEIRKYNGLLRYSQGTLENGFAITAMAYSNKWTSTDQVPERAVNSGYIGLYDSMDPTDGGDAQRYSLSAHWHHSDENGSSKVQAYAIRSSLELFNNFTYFLDHPDVGDQFRQFDQRSIVGGMASHTFKNEFAGIKIENEFGLQTRYDDIHVGLQNTYHRVVWSTTRDDSVQEGNVGLFFENRVKWNDWLRTTVGVRQDFYSAHVASDTPANSGDTSDSMASPKFGVVFGPFWKTELFANAGTGFHSNDVRGATISVDPKDKTTPLDRVPLLVRSQGAEAGVRTKIINGLDSSVSLFILDFDSENLFVGDAGTTEASRPSRRTGVEWANHYKPKSWLSFDADLAISQAKFTDYDPAGDHIPGAPTIIASAGVTIGEAKGWYAGANVRYFAPRPLIEDNSIRSPVTLLLNARIGYHFEDGWTAQLDGFNLTNSDTSQIDYAYVSRLPGEPMGGVLDRVLHPVEPLAVRLTLAKQF
jgi:outer membrane receptor protein involved in Fe transport